MNRRNRFIVVGRLFGVLFFLVVNVLPAKAFETEGVGLGGLFGRPIHQNITREGLYFLNKVARDRLANRHPDIEKMQVNQWHFDNCGFTDASDNIRHEYKNTISSISANALDDALASFGSLLHPVQDFYAHSNWVELEAAGEVSGLIDDTENDWWQVEPYKIYKGVLVLQEPPPSNGYTYALNSQAHLVTVTTPIGAKVPGLITGAYDNPDPARCPLGATLQHGHYRDEIPTGPGVADLMKDYEQRPLFDLARKRAVEQTTHEWCRLLALLQRQTNGSKLIDNIFNAWVANKDAAKAVCNKRVNVALIIDETGSMGWNDPNRQRVEAAKAFVDTAQVGDQIAVIGFSESFRVLAPLTQIVSDTTKTTLKAAIDGISIIGGTDLNTGLQGGFLELSKDSSQNSAAVFLTDGQQIIGPYNDQSHKQYADKGWPVYTIGLSQDADAQLLGRIANETGGTYTALSSANDLTGLYAQISQHISKANTAFKTSITMTQGSSQQLQANVANGQTVASFFASWPGSEVSMKLISPSGRTIDPATTTWDVYHGKGKTYEIYKLNYPEGGIWTLNLFGTQLAPQGESVDVQVFVQGRKELYLPLVRRDPSAPPPATPPATATPLPVSTITPTPSSTATTVPTATPIPTTTPFPNTAPLANNQDITAEQDTAQNITLTASDDDNDPLSYNIVSNPVHGALSGTPPNMTYTPNAGFNGADSFTFKANDGKADSNLATVVILVMPGPIDTPTPTPTATAITCTPFADDFSSPSSGWWQVSNADFSFGYVGGEYEAKLLKSGRVYLSSAPLSGPLRNGTVSVDGRFSSGVNISYGIVLAGETTGFYAFYVNSVQRTFSIWIEQNSSWHSLVNWTNSTNINAGGATNHLKATKQENHLMFYVNDKLLGDVYDNTFHQGYVALVTENGPSNQPPMSARFDNFSIQCP